MTEPAPTAEELSKHIDTTWRYSWHWERDRNQQLTLCGWTEALRDAEIQLAEAEVKAHRLRNFIPRIEAEVARMQEWAREDSNDA